MNHNIGMPCHFAHFQPMCKLSYSISIIVFMQSACKKNDKSSYITAKLGATKSALFTKCNFMGVSSNLFFMFSAAIMPHKKGTK